MATLSLDQQDKLDKFIADNGEQDRGRASSALGFDTSGANVPSFPSAPVEYARKDSPGGDMIDNATGNPVTHSDDPNATPPYYSPGRTTPPTTANTPFDAAAEVAKIFAGSGFGAGSTDVANLAGKNPEDRAKFIADLTKQRDLRAAPTASAGGTGGDAGFGGMPGIKPGWVQGPGGQYVFTGTASATPGGLTTSGRTSSPPFQNTSPMFSDPASRLIEDYALDRFQHLQNPDPNSGTAMYEQYLKDLVTKLKNPVYSDTEASQLKASVYDSMETERQQTKERWMQELSRRNIPPSSGPALEGLAKIDAHYDQLRTVADREFAVNAIGLRKQQDQQGAGVLSSLAGSEEGRLTNALTYASLPKQLSDNSFQQGLQLVGAGGSPSSLLQSALQIATQQQNASQQSSANKAALTQGLLSYLGYLFG